MRRLYNPVSYMVLLILVTTLFSAKTIAQSAIGQLETISGQQINSSSVSSPSMSTMVGGMILESLLNNLFTPTPTTYNMEAEAKAKAEAEAAKAKAEAIAKAKKEAEENAKIKRYNDSKQDLPDASSTDLEMMSLPSNTSNNFFGSGNNGVDIGNAIEISGEPQLNSDVYFNPYAPENPPRIVSADELKIDDTVNYLEQDIPSISMSPDEAATYFSHDIPTGQEPSMADVASLVQAGFDVIAKNPDIFKKVVAGSGVLLSSYSFYQDFTNSYRDFPKLFNDPTNPKLIGKTLYDVSNTVLDASLIVAGTATVTGVAILGAPVAGFSATATLALAVGSAAVKMYVWHSNPFYEKK